MSLCDLIDERGPQYVCKRYDSPTRDEMLYELDINEFEFLFRMGLFKEEMFKLFSKKALYTKISASSFNTMMIICDLFPIEMVGKEQFKSKFEVLTYHRLCYYLCYYRPTMIKFMTDGYLTQKLFCKVFEKSTLDQILYVANTNPYLSPMVNGLKKIVYHSLLPIRNGTSFNGEERTNHILYSGQKAYCKGVIDNIISFIY